MATLSSILKGFVKGAPNAEQSASITRSGDLYVAQHLPDMTSLSAQGKIFTARESATAAALVAKPTTTAGFTLQNPNSSDKLYVVLAVFAEVDVVPATVESFGIVHMRNNNAVANFTRDVTAVQPWSAGFGDYAGQAILDEGATVVDDGWNIIGNPVNMSKASASWSQIFVPLPIPIVLAAGGAYSLEFMASVVTTVEGGLGFVWAEVDPSEVK